MGRRLLLQRLALRSQPLSSSGEPKLALCGISAPFGTLSPIEGQIIYVLRTRAPLYSGCPFHARLACVRRAANVRSEPGSNSPVIKNCELQLASDFRSVASLCSHEPRLEALNITVSKNLSRYTHCCVCVSLRFSFQRLIRHIPETIFRDRTS
jgi:hypothetical protein